MTKTLIVANYARTGGTLLNRILAADDRLVCLSEINSRFTCPTEPNTAHTQVRQWYQMDISGSTPLQQIVAVHKQCDEQNKNLVIRDWSFASFVPLKYNNHNAPGTLNTIDGLQKHFPLEAIGLVRNPIDVWLSMYHSSKTFHDRSLTYYRQFVEDLLRRDIPVIKYEDLTTDPRKVIGQLYTKIDTIPPATILLSDHVTGDINFSDQRRTLNKNAVTQPTRRQCTQDEKRFIREETECLKILDLLNYAQE